MHPIEQLRYVARAGGADGRILVEDATRALTAVAGDRAGLLMACKRLLTRQPSVGVLWWMCTRLVLAAEPRSEGRALLAELESDRTADRLAFELPEGAVVALSGWPDTVIDGLASGPGCSALVVDVDGTGPSAVRRLERSDVEAEAVDGSRTAGVVAEADVVVIEARACGRSAALVGVGDLALAAVAGVVGRPVWLVVPTGVLLPEQYWQELVERLTEPSRPAFLQSSEVVALGLVDRLVRPDGGHDRTESSSATADCVVAPELLVPAR